MDQVLTSYLYKYGLVQLKSMELCKNNTSIREDPAQNMSAYSQPHDIAQHQHHIGWPHMLLPSVLTEVFATAVGVLRYVLQYETDGSSM